MLFGEIIMCSEESFGIHFVGQEESTASAARVESVEGRLSLQRMTPQCSPQSVRWCTKQPKHPELEN